MSRKEAERVTKEGIQKALNNADNHIEGWSNLAFSYLKEYIDSHEEFMVEDVRVASMVSIPVPPNTRAWGGIIIRARNEGLVKQIGYCCVKNEKAHMTPASIWRKIR